MADAGAIKAGEAFVEIVGKDDKLRKDLAGMQQRVGATLNAITAAAAAFSLRPILQSATAVFDLVSNRGRDIFSQAQERNIPAPLMARLAAAADQAGVSMEALGDGLSNLGRVANVRDVDAIADRLLAIEDAGARADAIVQHFGTRANFGPVLQALRTLQDGEGLARQAAEANAFGWAMDRLSYSVSAAGRAIGAVLAPVARPVIDMLTGAASAVRQWTEENPRLVQTLGLLSAGVVAAGAGLIVLAGGLAAGRLAAQALATSWKALQAVFSLGLGLASSPLAWIAAGVVAGIAGFASLTQAGRDLMQSLGATFSTTWGGILDAIKGGNLQLAWSIAVAGLKVAWLDFVGWFETTLPSISAFLRGTFDVLGKALEGWKRFFAWVQDVRQGLASGTTWDRMLTDEARANSSQTTGRGKEDARGELARLRAEAEKLAETARRRLANQLSTQTGPQSAPQFSRGTFSGAIGFGLIGNGGPMRDIATSTRASAETLGRIENHLGRMRELRFG